MEVFLTKLNKTITTISGLTYGVNYAILFGLSLMVIMNNLPYMKVKIQKTLIWSPTLAKRITLTVFLFIFTFQLVIPRATTRAFAQELVDVVDPFTQSLSELIPFTTSVDFPNTFPTSIDVPRMKIKIPISAYNSLAGQTDSTPCIAARGYNLCEANEENVLAANFLPIGTKVKIPELFGNREFTVVDRMNARYWYRADIWMREYQDAKNFGLKYATIEVY